MRKGRVVAMVVLAALIAAPLAYAQLGDVILGTDMILEAFGPADPAFAALGQ